MEVVYPVGSDLAFTSLARELESELMSFLDY